MADTMKVEEKPKGILGKIKEAADDKVLSYSDVPLVSSDFNHCSQSAIFDATQTQVLNKNLKIWQQVQL